jgi:hypothetical protein
MSSILAIDLGKFNKVAWVHDRSSGEIRFATVDTTGVELQRSLATEQPGVVTIEVSLLPRATHRLVGALESAPQAALQSEQAAWWTERASKLNPARRQRLTRARKKTPEARKDFRSYSNPNQQFAHYFSATFWLNDTS